MVISTYPRVVLKRVYGEVNMGGCVNDIISVRGKVVRHIYCGRGGVTTFGDVCNSVPVSDFCASSVDSGPVVSLTGGTCLISNSRVRLMGGSNM